MNRFDGIPVSGGIAIGNLKVIKNIFLLPPEKRITEKQIDSEIEKFEEALKNAEKDILDTQKKVSSVLGKKYAEIFAIHTMFLQDKFLREQTIRNIRTDQVEAIHAFHKTIENLQALFGKTDGDLVKDRRRDLLDVAERIFSYLRNEKKEKVFDKPVIVVAHDLSPSQTVSFEKKYVLGFATEIGSETSHTAIMAKALEIPAVVGLGDILQNIIEDQAAILDGTDGRLIIEPSSMVLSEYRKRRAQFIKQRKTFYLTRKLEAKTEDRVKINLLANISLPEEATTALKYGAEGIGLFRTEFLFLNRNDLPSEDEQYESYKKVASIMEGRQVIIRTLDIGGDKFLSSFQSSMDLNPFLGWRAIRFCLSRKDIFKTQLKAILRAGYHGNFKIMIPMVSTFEEIKKTRQIIAESIRELKKEKKQFKILPVGIMIEIPSAALQAESFAKESDFFSLGTNDLIQYTIAVDRINEKISYLYQPCNPAVLKLVAMTVDAARKANIEVSVCGETASLPETAVFFIGIGIKNLSMAPAAIPQIKQLIRRISYERAKELSEKVFIFSTHKEIFEFLKKNIEKDLL
ncbi:MAG TPA: phosphoenolpyruvate--protein phosphotransferase [bacterium]|nr:phosphoenolpyruvate--protein phosphotransferase [bacterium]HPO51274.1 phosphoenolpyruvate--protein phosphotransferase [bacterium]